MYVLALMLPLRRLVNGDDMQDGLLPASDCLVQQEGSQPRHRLPATVARLASLRPALRWGNM